MPYISAAAARQDRSKLRLRWLNKGVLGSVCLMQPYSEFSVCLFLLYANIVESIRSIFSVLRQFHMYDIHLGKLQIKFIQNDVSKPIFIITINLTSAS